jgi:hypothetical protein
MSLLKQIYMSEVEQSRYFIVYFKKEEGKVIKKVKVKTGSGPKDAILTLCEEESIPDKLVKEMFGQEQLEGIKYIRRMEEINEYIELN